MNYIHKIELDFLISTRYKPQKNLHLEVETMLNPIFDRFVRRKSPLTVMARGLMERIVNPEQLDQWFDQTAKADCRKELLFSSVFDIIEPGGLW